MTTTTTKPPTSSAGQCVFWSQKEKGKLRCNNLPIGADEKRKSSAFIVYVRAQQARHAGKPPPLGPWSLFALFPLSIAVATRGIFPKTSGQLFASHVSPSRSRFVLIYLHLQKRTALFFFFYFFFFAVDVNGDWTGLDMVWQHHHSTPYLPPTQKKVFLLSENTGKEGTKCTL